MGDLPAGEIPKGFELITRSYQSAGFLLDTLSRLRIVCVLDKLDGKEGNGRMRLQGELSFRLWRLALRSLDGHGETESALNLT